MAAPAVSSYALKRAEKELAQTKIIIRHLPPDITQDQLMDILSPALPNHTSFVFVPGRPGDPYSYSRAYLNITNTEDIRQFRDSFDGHQLESTTSKSKYRMIIEYAPYQSSGARRTKPDARCDTIEKDPDYVSFLEKYEKEVVYLPSIDLSYLDHIEVIADVQSTPLVDYITNKKYSRRVGGASRNKVTYVSGSKKKREKVVKVIEVKEKSSSRSSSSKDRKEKSSSSSGSGSSKKINDNSGTDKLLTNGETVSVKGKEGGGGKGNEGERSEGGSESRASQKPSRSKERPDQTFYSPRTTRNTKSGAGKVESSRTSEASEPRRHDRSSRGDRSDRNGIGSTDKGGSKSSVGGGSGKGTSSGESDSRRNGSERGGRNDYGGSKRNWYNDETGSSRSSYGRKPQSSYKNEHYYQFQDDDEDTATTHHHYRSHSGRDDQYYRGGRGGRGGGRGGRGRGGGGRGGDYYSYNKKSSSYNNK